MSDTASWGAHQYPYRPKHNTANNKSNEDNITITFSKDEFLQIALAAHSYNKSVNEFILDASSQQKEMSSPELLIEGTVNGV